MDKAIQRLKRVLDLEIEQGYANKAVVGGIQQFAAFWITQAQEEAAGELDLAFIEQVAEVLQGYAQLPGPEARAKAVETLVMAMARRPQPVDSPAPSSTRRSEPEKKRRTRRKSKPSSIAQEEGSSPAGNGRTEPEEREFRPARSEDDYQQVVTQPPAETADPDPEGLAQSVTAIRGVGEKIAEKLAILGVETIQDLLYLFPHRYDDYSLLKPINRLDYGETVTVIGTIWQTRKRRIRNNKILVETIINDGTGSVQATWFNQPWLADQFKAGKQVVLSGKVDLYLGRKVFNSPQWEYLELEPLKTRRIVPVYPLTRGLNSNKMRDIMQKAIHTWSARVPDPLPEDIRKRHNLYPLSFALQQIHFPDSTENLRRARERLTFDELFLLQLGMLGQRRDWIEHPTMPLPVRDGAMEEFIGLLPFRLTAAQDRVIGEILNDIQSERPMNRLLQGDVGSGKTVVAAAAMVVAARAGAQAALMAPTEILTEQHYAGLCKMLQPLELQIALLTGSTSSSERDEIYAGLQSGAIDIVIGTHALIQPVVEFSRLGLVVIDEQHRFGVDQRGALRDKGPLEGEDRLAPHLLVMSATPIPRSLALSLYGDLDPSILDEMPPGRQEIRTRWLKSSERERAYSFIRGQIAEGRQAFIIYPLVEESETIDALSAVEEFQRLEQEVFSDLTIGLIHGRMKAARKEESMRHFHDGETQILVATSVIEVGVDVSNSTVMMIEGADRFGLAQLHQFRGRVGRGEFQSYCILVADEVSTVAEKRLEALEDTNDGFVLAERDLELRGPGEFFGRQQSGLPELRLASLLHDIETMETARSEARSIFETDPYLNSTEYRLMRQHVAEFWDLSGDIS